MLFTFLLVSWVIFAPVPFGGSVSYVVVSGNSMEPHLGNGDLAIVRVAERYQPGDIVAYRHPDVGPVIHRIQALENDRFVLRGDNNSWTDSYDPAGPDLIGALWVQVPHVGTLMELTRSAGMLPILGGLGGAIAMATILASGDKNQGPRRRRRSVRPLRVGAIGENAQSMLSALGMAVAAFIILGVFSFAQPAEQVVPKEAHYQQSGTFTYSADVPEDGLYDSAGVTTGEPVYRRLTDRVDVSFAYQFESGEPSEVSGVHLLTAVLTDNTGWKRTLPLTRQTSFDGNAFTVEGTLDLEEVETLINGLETRTGIKKDYYELAVVPDILASGTVAGQPFIQPFAPRLKFRIDPLQLQMLPRGPQEAEPRSPSQPGAVQVMRPETNSLSILGLKVNVADARRLVVFGIGLCMATALGFGFYVLRGVGGDEPSRIAARLGPMLVSIRADGARAGRVTDVESIDDLAKLAERGGVMVLHEVKGATHQYLVQDGQTTFRYQAFGRAGETVAAEAAELAGR